MYRRRYVEFTVLVHCKSAKTKPDMKPGYLRSRPGGLHTPVSQVTCTQIIGIRRRLYTDHIPQ